MSQSPPAPRERPAPGAPFLHVPNISPRLTRAPADVPACPPTDGLPPLRILHAVFTSRLAGSELHAIDLANRQAQLGHEVHFAGPPGPLFAGELRAEVHFHPLGRILRGVRLRRLADRLDPTICHAHLSRACKAFARSRLRSRTVATLHLGYKPAQHARLAGLICVNSAQLGHLATYRGARIEVSNWVPAPRVFAPGPGLREELGLPAETFLVGSVGRLHRSKGMDLLVAAFQRVATAQAALVIIGEGPERARLRRLSAGDRRIHLLGYRTDIPRCLEALDLFVSASHAETCGLALLEAMQARLPVVSTATEGPREYLLQQGATLVPVGSIEALADAIARAQLTHRPGARRHVDYSPDLLGATARVQRILEFYRRLPHTGICPLLTASLGVAAAIP